eukprot:COSAG06_NODE_2611_length_6581_cov_21.257443_2_plen_60_part_00
MGFRGKVWVWICPCFDSFVGFSLRCRCRRAGPVVLTKAWPQGKRRRRSLLLQGMTATDG